VIHAFFRDESYWAPNITLPQLDRALARSLVIGAYAPDGQIAAFARVVTDYVVFAYLRDVFTLPAHRGKGLAAGRKRDLAIQIASSVGAAPLVREGLGIALVDGLVAWHDFEGLATHPFFPHIDMQVAVSVNDARPESRFLQPFLAALRATI
jgi:DNA-binding transcriptional LysR family regulator